jgi:cytoskeletal protein RodZ
MAIHPFYHDLKNAREAKGISLQEISATTLINPKFLEAIEEGNFTILPQTYIRAFIREYAQVVGLNPQETLRKYEEATTGGHHPLGGSAGAEETVHEEYTAVAPPEAITEQRRGDPRLLITRLATGVVILAAAGLVIYQIFLRHDPATPVETPFQNVVAENEQRARQAAAEPVRKPAPAAQTVFRDSLTLRATVLDTVWLQIVIDQQAPRDFIFPPRTRALWKARERFRLTLGNAGGVEFTLNEKALGALGKRGAVIRDVDITRSTLEH